MRSKLVIYRNKPMLNAKEAESFLAELTNNQVTLDDLLEIGKAYNLKAYLRAVDLDNKGIDHKTGEVKCLKGLLHECVTGLQFAFADKFAFFDTDCIKLNLNIDPDNIITGRGFAFLDDEDDAEVIEWRATPDVVGHIDGVPLFFIPTDIENLAAQINGKPLIQEELEQLRQQVAELEEENKNLKEAGAVAGGLVFSYSTPELEAMQKAANQFWRNYDPSKRQPLQKEVGYEIAKLLELQPQGNGSPPRLAEQYATAIKPKKYR